MCADHDGFLSNLQTVRRRVGRRLAQSEALDRPAVVALLCDALVVEVFCVTRYMQHYGTAEALGACVLADEFLTRAAHEQDHADRIIRRITELDGRPALARRTLHCWSEGGESRSLMELVRDDIAAEREAIAMYREMILRLSDDPVTRTMLVSILEREEAQTTDLADLLDAHVAASRRD